MTNYWMSEGPQSKYLAIYAEFNVVKTDKELLYGHFKGYHALHLLFHCWLNGTGERKLTFLFFIEKYFDTVFFGSRITWWELVSSFVLKPFFFLGFVANIVLGSGSFIGRFLTFPAATQNGQTRLLAPPLTPVQVCPWSYLKLLEVYIFLRC